MQPVKLPSQKLLILILTMMAAFGPLSIDFYLSAFLDIETELKASSADIQQTLTTFLFGLCIGMMFYGSLSDKYGRRILVLIGAIIYVITSVACAFSTDITYLIIARFLQAIGAGACMVVGRAIIRDVFTGKKVAMMMSVVQVVLMTAPLLAPILGAELLIFFKNWRVLFLILAVFGVFVFAATFFYLPETYRKEDREETSILGTFYNYITILKDPTSLGFILACALPSGIVFAYITGSPHLYQGVYGISKRAYGLMFGLNIIGIAVSALLNIYFLRRFSVNGLILFGLTWMALAGILTFIIATHSLFGFALSIFLLICVSGFVGNNLASRIIELNYHKAGAAMALNSASQFAIGALASFMVSHIEGSLTYVMGGCAISALCCYLLTLKSKKAPK